MLLTYQTKEPSNTIFLKGGPLKLVCSHKLKVLLVGKNVLLNLFSQDCKVTIIQFFGMFFDLVMSSC